MKTLIRIFLFLLAFALIALGGVYFALTRPAIQKKLVQSQLPAGSSINYVRVTTSSLELTDLKVQLPDGTTAKLDRLISDFSPLAALLHNTVELRGVAVEGLIVKLPELPTSTTATPSSGAITPSGPSDAGAGADVVSDASQPVSPRVPGQLEATSGSPADALYALGDLNWLFDVDHLALSGALIDAERNRYTFDVSSDEIAPGVETHVDASLSLESQHELQGGLQDFASDARLVFTQKATGGFEQLRLESHTSGSDVNGGDLLTITQTLDFSMNGFEETASLALSFNVDLPHPEVFVPELIALQGLSLQGDLQASALGTALTLKSADFQAAANGEELASIKLKQALTLGAEQQFSGELMQVNLINLPLAWLNPWLSDGIQLSGAALSAQVVLSGEPNGALSVQTLSPIELGPLSLYQYQQVLLEEVSLRMNPVVRVAADQSVQYDLGDLQLLDRYGAVIAGTVSGAIVPAEESSLFAGIQTQAKLDVGIAELLQQPALAGVASVMAGQAKLNLEIDGAAEYPAKLQASITGLRARKLPGSSQDYRLAAQLKQASDGNFAIGSNFQAGSDSRPSTSLQLAGQVNLEQQPMPFKLSLTGSSVLQDDIDLLLAMLDSEAVVVTTPEPTQESWGETPSSINRSVSSSPAANSNYSVASAPTTSGVNQVEAVALPRPPWADLDGEVSIKLDSLTLATGHIITGIQAQALISEALLRVSDLAATIQGGTFGGEGEMSYDPTQSRAYELSSALNFKNIDPAMFAQSGSGSFPVTGVFDGELNLTGSGASLEQAVEDSESDLTVTGREGVLTAFELDNRSQLGLLGAGILGQTLKRPGITAMAQAVPYFKEMNFDTFTLKLVRAQDKQVRIPELSFVGDNLRLDGEGVIAASSLSEVLNQPLQLSLGLAAKGQLIDYLDTLQLLGSTTSEDGFRAWNQAINIGGTLGDPDTSALKDLLNNAARNALSQSEKSTSVETDSVLPGGIDQQDLDAVPADEDKSKDEQLRDDIEMGIDLLNSFFG
jgi:hypothetical protein